MTDLTRTDTVLTVDGVKAAFEEIHEQLHQDGTERDALTARVAVLEKALAAMTPPAPPVRPVLAGHVRFEDLAREGDSIREVLARVPAGKILNLPAGTFEFADFLPPTAGQPYVAGLTMPGNCAGIVGQGVGQTVLRMTPRTSTQAARVPTQTKAPASNPLCLIQAYQGLGQLFESFTLEGTEQGHLYGGLHLAYATNPIIRDVLVTGIPGDRNSPPGETFAISVWHGSGMVGERIEVDGRRDGKPASASPFGFNSTTKTLLVDCYFHHCLASTLTYWETTDSSTVRVRSEYNGTGTTAGMQYAHGINHERSGNIRHTSPIIVIDQAVNPTGYHVSWNSDVAPSGGLVVENPSNTMDKRVPDGRLVIMTFNQYRGKANTLLGTAPVVQALSTAAPIKYAWAH